MPILLIYTDNVTRIVHHCRKPVRHRTLIEALVSTEAGGTRPGAREADGGDGLLGFLSRDGWGGAERVGEEADLRDGEVTVEPLLRRHMTRRVLHVTTMAAHSPSGGSGHPEKPDSLLIYGLLPA